MTMEAGQRNRTTFSPGKKGKGNQSTKRITRLAHVDQQKHQQKPTDSFNKSKLGFGSLPSLI
jgi:peptide subunit release factor 1 (eRF1)